MRFCNSCNSWYSSRHCDCGGHSYTDCCSCITDTKGNCVFYQGTSTTCLGITKGDNYDAIIRKIDMAICQLSPSGNQKVYVVQGTSGEIDVNSSTTGNTTTYTVSLDPDVTNHLDTIDTQIAGLQDCCVASLKSITTGTPSNLVITTVGNTVNIDYQNTVAGFGGIVTNDVQNTKLLSNATNVTVLSRNIDFASKGAAAGDVLEFKYSLQLGTGDSFSIIFKSGSSLFYSTYLTSTIDSVTSWNGTITFNLTSTTSAVVNSQIFHNFIPNEITPLFIDLGVVQRTTNGQNSTRAIISNGIDLSNFQFDFIMSNNNSTRNAVFGDVVTILNKKLP